ncbi:unnamed protein product [Lactuca saligna]|uniref:Peroxiredoxin Q, chloroplastic n=1 Tax=Lactuca saligna TaxID=75948 RepID=A0AA35ZZA6_LACSI|nr:unnamed protein product [Lactuca saligna]
MTLADRRRTFVSALKDNGFFQERKHSRISLSSEIREDSPCFAFGHFSSGDVRHSSLQIDQRYRDEAWLPSCDLTLRINRCWWFGRTPSSLWDRDPLPLFLLRYISLISRSYVYFNISHLCVSVFAIAVSLSKFKGKPLVVYFYPADETLICAKQACAFRDSYEKFKKAGAQVIGISTNPGGGHQHVVEGGLPDMDANGPAGNLDFLRNSPQCSNFKHFKPWCRLIPKSCRGKKWVLLGLKGHLTHLSLSPKRSIQNTSFCPKQNKNKEDYLVPKDLL